MAIKWGNLIIGVSSGLISVRFLQAAFRAEDALDRIGRGGVACPGGDPKCSIRPAGSGIERRASYIGEMVWKSSLDPKIRMIAMRTLNRKCDGRWCTPPRAHMDEVKTLAGEVFNNRKLWSQLEGHFAWVKENVAYRKDHAYVDQFAGAKRTIEQRGEDCDGHTILLGALNLTSGFPVGMRIYQTKEAADWNHIASIVQVPPHVGDWYVLDASVDRVREGGKAQKIYPGWGAPADIVKRHVDYQILPGGRVKKIAEG